VGSRFKFRENNFEDLYGNKSNNTLFFLSLFTHYAMLELELPLPLLEFLMLDYPKLLFLTNLMVQYQDFLAFIENIFVFSAPLYSTDELKICFIATKSSLSWFRSLNERKSMSAELDDESSSATNI
jgi:hypothetical protein